MSFLKDLKFGNIYENKLCTILKNDRYVISKGNFKEYDVILYNGDIETKYEVKADRIGYKTGNIVIERECNKNLSGISTTEADFYAYFIIKDDNFELYVIPVDEIRKVINEKKYAKIVKGGDNRNSELFIFKKEIFINYLYDNII